MGYWGWRPLVLGLFISTWVAGCNIVADNTSPSASPNVYADVTLTVGRISSVRASPAPTRAAPTPVPTPSPASPATYVVQPGDTLDGIADQFGISADALQSANGDLATLVPGQPLVIPTALPLVVEPPTCYETHPGGLLCLGRVDNPLDFPVESVTVEVRLRQADGSILVSERSTVEQISIPAGSFAPYQATFAVDADQFASADASLIGAVRGSADRFVVLLIQDVQGETVDGRLVVSALLYNPGPQNAEIVRAFLTLLDNLGRVIGYRVLTFDAGVILDAGGHLPLSIDLTPQVIDATPQYALYVEAHAVATETASP